MHSSGHLVNVQASPKKCNHTLWLPLNCSLTIQHPFSSQNFTTLSGFLCARIWDIKTRWTEPTNALHTLLLMFLSKRRFLMAAWKKQNKLHINYGGTFLGRQCLGWCYHIVTMIAGSSWAVCGERPIAEHNSHFMTTAGTAIRSIDHSFKWSDGCRFRCKREWP